MFFLISLILGGLIIGALGRLAVPGPNPMSVGMTILVGIAGSLVGGFVGYLLFHRAGGWILAVICTAGIVYFMQRREVRS
ncbi:MAG TPA: hypothetical protein VHC63_03340 [Acidimicrobiales bacterium]|nr:hypothetical protein [Acidimicrobiales bacterium]